MPLTVPELVLRIPKGSAITMAENDSNLTKLRDAINAMAALMSALINDDGTLKDGAVSSAAKIADRVITQAKLNWLWTPFGVATGTDTYAVTISPTTDFAYSAGMVIMVQFGNANTAAAPTLDVNSSGTPKTIKDIGGTTDLPAGAIVAGGIYWLVYDGTFFQLQSVTTLTSRTYVSGSVAVPARGANVSFAHGFGGVPTDFTAYMVCETDDAGYVTGERAEIAGFVENHAVGARDPLFVVWADTEYIWIARQVTADTDQVMDKNGAWQNLTAANWKLVVTARYAS